MSQETVYVDGSMGEGGGQILRTSLALSLVSGRPIRVEKIRANRKNPGLQRQHLTAVEAAAKVGSAALEGAFPGSKEITFVPGKVIPGRYRFSVGTAGSTTLVLQTILPSLMIASAGSDLLFEGGTHNPMAPPFDFLEKAFLPVVSRMGPRILATLNRPGFYPAGGGSFSVEVHPVPQLERIDVLERGEILLRRAIVILARLPRHIAERELAVIRQRTKWPEQCLEIRECRGSAGPGNVVLIEIESRNITEVIASFGEKGIPAERVAEKALQEMILYVDSGVAVGRHLADQLLLPFAIGGGGSFTTLPLSKHAITNIEVLKKFYDLDVRMSTVANQTLVELAF